MIGDPGDTITALASWTAWRAAQFDALLQTATDAVLDLIWTSIGLGDAPRLNLEEIL